MAETDAVVAAGLILETFMSLLRQGGWLANLTAAVVIGIVMATWRAHAMRRALDGQSNTPFQSCAATAA